MRPERLWRLLAVMIFLVSGCRSAFQPPPDSFERWRKEDTFVQQVMAVLLECGYPWPGSSVGDWGKAYGVTWESNMILAKRCMEKQGFVERYNNGSAAECKYYSSEQTKKYQTEEQNLAIAKACHPDTPPTVPSVERRLNSPYCKTEWARKYPQCQPVVVPSVKK